MTLLQKKLLILLLVVFGVLLLAILFALITDPVARTYIPPELTPWPTKTGRFAE